MVKKNSRPLPPNWTRARVCEVGSLRLGRQRSPDKHTGRHSTKYLRAKNLTSTGLDLSDVFEMDFTPSERETFMLRHGDLLIAEASGSPKHVGRSAMWRDEIPNCCFQNTLIRLRPHALTPKYGLLALQHLAATGQFAKVARGVGIQHLGVSRFGQMEMSVPPLEEQARIATVANQKLKELQLAVSALRSALRGNNEQVGELLTAAATGQLVEQAPAASSKQRRRKKGGRHAPPVSTDSLFPEETSMDTARLPRGWALTTVQEAGTVMLGKMRHPRNHSGSNMQPYLRVANVLEAHINVSDVHEMHFSAEEEARYTLRSGDVLLNEGQSPELVGRPALFTNQLPHVCFQNTLLRFRPGPTVDSRFALIVFRYYLHAGVFRRSARWSTNIAHLTKARFAELTFPLPPLKEQTRIAFETEKRLHALSLQRHTTAASLEATSEMHRAILEAAVNGSLVAQSPGDVPISLLPEELRTVRHDGVSRRRLNYARDDAVTKRLDATRSRSLEEALLAAGRALSLPELCRAAGYDHNSVEDIERFYCALRRALNHTIRVAHSADENTIVELADATQ